MAKEKHEEGNLKKLKEEYEKLRKKHNLPDFKFMNENFAIEDIDVFETELFVRLLRKRVAEKIFFISRSLEMLTTLQSAPLFAIGIVKSFSEKEKDAIKSLYKRMAKYEIESFGLDIQYDEDKEIEFVKSACGDWKEISEAMTKIYHLMKAGYNKEAEKQSRGYFG